MSAMPGGWQTVAPAHICGRPSALLMQGALRLGRVAVPHPCTTKFAQHPPLCAPECTAACNAWTACRNMQQLTGVPWRCRHMGWCRKRQSLFGRVTSALDFAEVGKQRGIFVPMSGNSRISCVFVCKMRPDIGANACVKVAVLTPQRGRQPALPTLHTVMLPVPHTEPAGAQHQSRMPHLL